MGNQRACLGLLTCSSTAQRAHANYTENLTPFLGALLVAGIQHPVPAAALGGVWSVSRLLYLLGYTSDAGPKGRITYVALLPLQPWLVANFFLSSGFAGSALSDLVLKGIAAYTCYQLIF